MSDHATKLKSTATVIRNEIPSATRNAPPNFSTGLKIGTFCTVEFTYFRAEL